jgi:hypothetical protein
VYVADGSNLDRPDVVRSSDTAFELHASGRLSNPDFPSAPPPAVDLGGGAWTGAQIAILDEDGRWLARRAACAETCDVRLLATNAAGDAILRTQHAWGGTRTERVRADGAKSALAEWGPPGGPYPSQPTPLGAVTCDAAAFLPNGFVCGGTSPPLEKVGDVLIGDGENDAPAVVALGAAGDVRWATVVPGARGRITDVEVLASGAVLAAGELSGASASPGTIGFVARFASDTGAVAWIRLFPLPVMRLAAASGRIALIARDRCARWLAVVTADGIVTAQRELPSACATSS